MIIRHLTPTDYPSVSTIYQQGIDTQNATFETYAPTWEIWHQRHLEKCRLVAVEGDIVTGFVVLMPYSSRTVYHGVGVLSIYVHDNYQRLGIGQMLLKALITESEQVGIWTLQAGILPENHASIALHRKLGFRKVGYREKIAQMNGQWRDILLLERRSRIVEWQKDSASFDAPTQSQKLSPVTTH
jgi:L-amino acid N-acyltransferase YncA